jgi:hypothetical protein
MIARNHHWGEFIMNLSIRLVLITWPVATWHFKPWWIVQNKMILLKMIKISVWLFYTIMKRSGALARESYGIFVVCYVLDSFFLLCCRSIQFLIEKSMPASFYCIVFDYECYTFGLLKCRSRKSYLGRGCEENFGSVEFKRTKCCSL